MLQYVCRELSHPLCVEVFYSLGDGVEHRAGLALWEEFLFEDPVQQLPASHQLCHQIHLLPIVIHLTDGKNTWRMILSVQVCVRVLTSFRVMIVCVCSHPSGWWFCVCALTSFRVMIVCVSVYTHILQGDDVGVLAVSQQDLNLLWGVCHGLVNHLVVHNNTTDAIINTPLWNHYDWDGVRQKTDLNNLLNINCSNASFRKLCPITVLAMI